MNQNSISTSPLSIATGASADAISQRAYELWEQEGRRDGCDLRHWLQAEKELSDLPQDSTATSRASGNGTPSGEGAERSPMGTTDVRPLQTARPGGPGGRDTKRPPGAPITGEKGGNSGQMTGRRK